jgi:hypothetical protein
MHAVPSDMECKSNCQLADDHVTALGGTPRSRRTLTTHISPGDDALCSLSLKEEETKSLSSCLQH